MAEPATAVRGMKLAVRARCDICDAHHNQAAADFLLLIHGNMPIREFTDSTGARWVVWSTLPSLGGLPGPMRDGWLTFDSSKSRRRLMPIPAGWEEAPPARLELLCRSAAEVRRTPANGFKAVNGESDP